MSIRDWLHSLRGPSDPAVRDTKTVRRIVDELDKLEARRARCLAAFAYLLGRVADADTDISDAETVTMVVLVERHGCLPRSQATLVVEVAKNQNELFGGVKDAHVTREFRLFATNEERRCLLDCLFAMAEADPRTSREENREMQRIADELGFEIEEYVLARLARRM